MKALRNFLVMFAMIGATLWLSDAGVSFAQIPCAGWSCPTYSCDYQFCECKRLAEMNFSGCKNSCEDAYPPGSTRDSCIQGCQGVKDNEMAVCNANKSGCQSSGQNWCTVQVCPGYCGSGNPVNMCNYNSCTDSCTVSCSCTGPRPNCPGGPDAAQCSGGQWVCYSPIVIDVEGDGIELTDAANGVYFDLSATGQVERWSWTTAQTDDAWLVLDRNGNGMIDDGTELFGSVTPQPPSEEDVPNGFLALAVYDNPDQGGDGNGLIDANDTIFSELRLWRDVNHNGLSDLQLGELKTLPELGIARLDLFYKEKKVEDQYGNAFRYRARVWDTEGKHKGRWAWDVFLVKVE